MGASSNEHCYPCAFGELPAASFDEPMLEERLVNEHLLSLVQEREEGSPPELWNDLSPRQKWAARQCALAIFSGDPKRCPKFTFWKSVDGSQVRIVHRNNNRW